MSVPLRRRWWLAALLAVSLAVVNTGLFARAETGDSKATIASHAEMHRKSISGMAFVGRESATTRAHNSGCVYRTGGTGPLVTSLQLPHGAVIKDVDYYYYATVNDSALRVNSYTANASAAPTAANQVTVNAATGTGYQLATTGALVTVDNVTNAYMLEWTPTVTDDTQRLCQVRVGYEVPSPENAELVFTPVKPCPVFDTRPGFGGREAPLTSGNPVGFKISGGSLGSQGGDAAGCGVPASARAVSLNLGAIPTHSSGTGNLKAWSTADTVPDGGVVGYSNGRGDSNEFSVAINAGQPLELNVVATGWDVNIRGVVLGYFAPADQRQTN